MPAVGEREDSSTDQRRSLVGRVRHLSRPAWAAVVAVALVLVIGGALLRPGGRIESDRSDHTVTTSALGALPPGESLVQRFTATGDGLSAVSLRFGTFLEHQHCTLDVRLETADGSRLFDHPLACADIPDAVPIAVVTLPPQAGSTGRDYVLTVTMRSSDPGDIAPFGVVPTPDRPPVQFAGAPLTDALELHTDYGHFAHAYDEIGTALRRIEQYGAPWRAPAVVVLLVIGSVLLLVALVLAPRRWGLLLLVAFAFLKGTLWSVVTPPLEGVDEPSHVSYAQFMSADHAIPRRDDNSRGPTTVSDELNTAIDVFHSRAAARDDRPDFGSTATGPGAAQLDRPLSQHANGNGTAAGYSPVYYAVPAVVDTITPGSIDARIDAMRLWSVVLGVATAVAAVFVARRVFPGRESLALLFGVAVALQPMLSQQTAIVNNDALVIAGGAWCFVLALELTRADRWRWAPLVAGLVLGVAVLGKPQALVWAPVLAVGWVIGSWRAGSIRGWWFAAGTAAGGLVASYGVWIVGSRIFDYPGVGITPAEPGSGRGVVDFLRLLRDHDFLALRRTWSEQFWATFSWNDVLLSDWVYRVITVALVAGVVLVGVWFVRAGLDVVRRSSLRRLAVDDDDAAALVCLAAVVGTLAELYLLAYQYFHNTGRNDFLQGRYALVVVLAVLLLPVLALRKLLPRLSSMVPVAALAAAMAVLNIAGIGVMVERFYL